jgi:PAS domain S-box-containing protein
MSEGTAMREKTNILVVDDRELNLTALEAVLAEPRYNLVKARSGPEALALANSFSFAVILLDVQMPGMDGFETAARLRGLAEHQQTPIIFVTAINKDDSFVDLGYKSGAVDYIFKPFDENILRSKVSVFVDLYEKTKKIEEQAQLIKFTASQERHLKLIQLEVEILRRYQSLADSIPHSVWRSKPDGTMDYFNKIWIQYTGLSEYQSMGVGWQSAFHDDDLRKFLKIWMEKITTGENFQVECRIRTAGGEMRWNLIHAIAERGVGGEIIAWLGTCTDISVRKDAVEKLIRAQQQADAANIAKTNFLANMSHEIRTPLNSILGFSELMLCPEQTEEERWEHLHTILKNGRTLVKIIDEILDISKVETGHLEMDMAEVDTCNFFGQLKSLLEVQARERGLNLGFHFKSPIPSKIMTDHTRFHQILVNIIGNSLKFTETGKVELEVTWKEEPDAPLSKGKLHCRIVDTGIGIDESEAQKLFQPFAQVDGSRTRKFGGTGLGLALSRRLARALGGDVFIQESIKDKGSVFVVEIAAAAAEDAAWVTTFEKTFDESAVISTKNFTGQLKDVQVLVVDDSVDNRNLITHFLKAAGAKVECAVDGVEGVKKAMENDFQIVLMDIQMPNLDGYKATAELRQRGYKKPIVALTAHAIKQERLNSISAGCDDHLTKPIDRKTLIESVCKFTQGLLVH